MTLPSSRQMVERATMEQLGESMPREDSPQADDIRDCSGQPLVRRKRVQSPAPLAAVPTPQTKSRRTPIVDEQRSSQPVRTSRLGARRVVACFSVLLGISAAIAACFKVSLALQAGDRPEAEVAASSLDLPPRSALSVENLAAAFRAPQVRAQVLDVLVGALTEFAADLPGTAILEHLPLLAAAAEGEATDAPMEAESEHALHVALAQLDGVTTSWPKLLQVRLENAFTGGFPSEVPSAPLRLEVDMAATSPEAVFADFWRQALLDLGAWTGLERFALRAAQFRSKPASVVTSHKPIVRGDCFAFQGEGTVVLDVCSGAGSSCHGDGAVVHSLVIEQPSRWEVPKPGTAPGNFSVRGMPADQEAGNSVLPVHLGSFDYKLAAPATQTFELRRSARVRALHVDFESQAWGEPYTCVYRIRAFGA